MTLKRKFLKNAFLVLLFAGALGTCVYELVQPSNFEITGFRLIVEDDGLAIHDREAIQKDIEGALEQTIDANLLMQDLQKVQNAVSGISWVKSAVVARSFPHELTVRISRYRPVARAKEEGKLISVEGIVYQAHPSDIADTKKLPIIACEESTAKEAVDQMEPFNGMARKIGMRLSEIVVSYRGSWIVRLTAEDRPSLEIELGRKTSPDIINRRLRLFVENYEKVVSTLQGYPRKVDTRYNNAFSVKLIGAENTDQNAATIGSSTANTDRD